MTLDTLDGATVIDIRPGTQSGESLVVKGQGAARLRSAGRGDLHVHLRVQTPTRLDAEQEALLRSFAALRDETTVQVGTASGEQSGGLFSRLKDAFTAK
jgi:molecular chaperone DnaJ